MNRKTTSIISVIVALSAATTLLAAVHPSGAWRVAALRLKLNGDLHHLTWRDVFQGLKEKEEGRIGEMAVNRGLAGMVTGRVTLASAEAEGECPFLWHTPFRPIWGGLDDDAAMEYLFDEQLRLRIYQNDLIDVNEGDSVLDVGSHLGTFTAAALANGAGLVVAFEPEPISIICFKRTFDEEIQEGRVVLVEAAASDRPGTLSFSVPPAGLSAMAKVTEDGELVVEAATIDEVVDRLGLDRVDFVKMDIEGWERKALAGARQVLAGFRPRMALAAYHKPDDPEVISQLVLDAHPGYKSVIRDGFAYFF